LLTGLVLSETARFRDATSAPPSSLASGTLVLPQPDETDIDHQPTTARILLKTSINRQLVNQSRGAPVVI
jgi:hypothetical protein